MSTDTDIMREDIKARRDEMMGTVMEIGNRFAVPRTTFFAGLFTGILLLALLNRMQFRRLKK
jgi:hypothetical protein